MCSCAAGSRRQAFGRRAGDPCAEVEETEIVHDQTARFVAEHAVDAGDHLHQAVPAHGLVHVRGVQARRIEAGEPHVTHQHNAEGVA